MLVKRKLESFEVDYVCDICKKGFLRPPDEGAIVNTNPTQYVHICTNCGGKLIVTGKMFPYMVTKLMDKTVEDFLEEESNKKEENK